MSARLADAEGRDASVGRTKIVKKDTTVSVDVRSLRAPGEARDRRVDETQVVKQHAIVVVGVANGYLLAVA